MQIFFFFLFFSFSYFISPALADCQTHLPLPSSSSSTRIISGIRAPSSFAQNVVTIARDLRHHNRLSKSNQNQRQSSSRDYTCLGTLLSPTWVLTAAQCFVSPARDFVLHGAGGHSLAGAEHPISRVILHPEWNAPANSDDAVNNDIQLIELSEAIKATSYMRINSNTAFPTDTQQYLRFKGFGLTQLPLANDVPLQRPRALTYADLKLSSSSSACPKSISLLCTTATNSCAPCYGDTGGPLYAVDKSGTVDVQVGILMLRPLSATNFTACTSVIPSSTTFDAPLPTLYTPVAKYIDWIRRYVRNTDNDDSDIFYEIPDRGIESVNLGDQDAKRTMSRVVLIIIVVVTVFVVLVVFIVVTFTLWGYARKKMRALDLDHTAEDSFVDPGGRFGDAEHDPFQGLTTRRATGEGAVNTGIDGEVLEAVLSTLTATTTAERRKERRRVRGRGRGRGDNESDRSWWWWMGVMNLIRKREKGRKQQTSVRRKKRRKRWKKDGQHEEEEEQKDKETGAKELKRIPSFSTATVSMSGFGATDAERERNGRAIAGADAPSWLDAAWERLFRPASGHSFGHRAAAAAGAAVAAPSHQIVDSAEEIVVQFEREEYQSTALSPTGHEIVNLEEAEKIVVQFERESY